MASKIDFESMRPKGSKAREAKSTEAANRRWWLFSGKEAADSITAVLNLLQDSHRVRVSQHALSARLYGNLPALGLAGISYSQLAATHAAFKDRITFNVIQSVVDTVTARIAKNKPKPYFLTNGGSSSQRRKAKKLNQFQEGIFYENQVEENTPMRFRDGTVWGDGVDHVFRKHDRICHERVLPSELWLDEIEGFYGNPRQIHRQKPVDKDVLIDEYPNHKNEIRDAPRAQMEDAGQYQSSSDMVMVRESWHLPSGPEAKDGKRICTIDGHALIAPQPWDCDYFPFAFCRWSPRLYGFWSQGLVEQLQNIQTEINKLLWIIQRSFQLGGAYKVFLKIGSKIVKEHIDNLIGGIVMYAGDTPPQYTTPPLVAPEIYQHLVTLVQKAYEMAGTTQMSATGQKPEGVDSGKALRTYDDINTDRYSTNAYMLQQYIMQLIKLDINTAKEIAEDNRGHYQVKVPGKKFLRTIDWEDINLEDDEYIMKCYPISALPNTPEGRLQTVQEFIQAGIYSRREGKRLMDFPDLQQVDSKQDVAEEILCELLDRIVDDGEYTPPEPSDDLQLAKEMVMQYIDQGRIDHLEPERMEQLRTFNSQVDAYQMAAQQAQMAAQAQAQPPMGGQPQAQPAAPPTSQLIPNVPQNGAAA